MKFHRKGRVRYAKNPLIEVVCEIRFPLQLELQDALPIDFQKEIASDFPILELQNELQVELICDSHNADFQGGRGLKQNQSTSYIFASVDRKLIVTLSAQALRLSSQSYKSWEEFECCLLKVFAAFKQHYSVDYFTRIGLRYRDLIDRRLLQCEETSWAELIEGKIFGAYNQFGFSDQDYVDFQQNVSLKLDTGHVNVAHSFVTHVKENHTAFLIDADFYLNEITKADINHVTGTLRDFNVQAGGFFRASISERLHELLEPTTLD